jgi:hypothetical protein
MIAGHLSKLAAALKTPVEYTLRLGEQALLLNEHLGKRLLLEFSGEINCIACGRKTAKSFNQGYCFPCTQRLARCDICVVRPERCHFAQGTCREPEWALGHCMRPHYVYLANSSGLKVGITRENQIPTRWIDQGATQALPLFKVQTRQQSGLIEAALREHVADKTDWRRMLKGEAAAIDLECKRDELLALCAGAVRELRQRFGEDAIEVLTQAQPVALTYPVLRYPSKITALDFDKTPEIGGTLLGIKGQYLILDHGVLNIRKFTGYNIAVSL